MFFFSFFFFFLPRIKDADLNLCKGAILCADRLVTVDLAAISALGLEAGIPLGCSRLADSGILIERF